MSLFFYRVSLFTPHGTFFGSTSYDLAERSALEQ